MQLRQGVFRHIESDLHLLARNVAQIEEPMIVYSTSEDDEPVLDHLMLFRDTIGKEWQSRGASRKPVSFYYFCKITNRSTLTSDASMFSPLF
jgi:hypothetical protein